MTHRGFNLLEVAVASALAGIISASAVASFALINRQLVRLQSSSVASDHAKSLIDLLVTDLQGVGGGPIRPWMALWVEDGGAGDPLGRNATFGTPPGESDRVTFATLIPATPTCSTTAVTPEVVASTGTGASCCLSQLLAAGSIAGTTSAHAYLIRSDRHRQITLTLVSAATCTATYAAGPLAPLDRPAADATFVGGSLVAASVKTLYLGANRELRLFEEKRGFNGATVTIDGDESSRVAGDILDFQIQLGFDRENDGRIADSSSAADEWLFNAAGDVPASFRARDMRMVGVGVIVGVPLTDPDFRSSARIVGGQTIAGSKLYLRGAMGRAALRNIFVFF